MLILYSANLGLKELAKVKLHQMTSVITNQVSNKSSNTINAMTYLLLQSLHVRLESLRLVSIQVHMRRRCATLVSCVRKPQCSRAQLHSHVTVMVTADFITSWT